MLHNSSSKRSIVICLPTGKSTALGWRVGCSSSDQLTMFQKPRSGNMCKKGYFPIGGYVGKRKKLTGLPFRRNVMNCGSMPQGRRGLIRSPLQSGTAGRTLSEQINNTTLNILHGVWRSDPPPSSSLPMVLWFSFLPFWSPVPFVPGHRVVICSRLLLCGGGLFAAFLGSSSPPGPPFFVWLFVCVFLVWAVLSLPSVCLWFRVSFPLVSGSSLWCFCCAGVFACVSAGVFSLAFVCLSWCGGASLRLSFSWLLSAPPSLVASPPLWLVPCGVLAQFLCWSLPLGIWLLLRRPGCLALMLGVWWCSVVLTWSQSCWGWYDDFQGDSRGSSGL